jgi:DNA-binding response OmpR family regulator
MFVQHFQARMGQRSRPGWLNGGREAGSGLEGVRVLLVEDEIMVALDLELALEEAGAEVIGPVMNLEEALRCAEREEIDVALLDVDLQGKQVYPAARVLAGRGVPFLFHTGHATREQLCGEFPNAVVCRKPMRLEELLHTLSDLVP